MLLFYKHDFVCAAEANALTDGDVITPYGDVDIA